MVQGLKHLVKSMVILVIMSPVTTLAQYTIRPSDIEMVYVEGGAFQMGSDDSDESAERIENPKHEVSVSDFQIGKYEVDQRLWENIMGTNPSQIKGDSLPVTNVSWNDVQEFIKRLNKITKKKYRLPTEAEWEYAARGGNRSQGFIYVGSNNPDSVAWHFDNSGRMPHKIGTKQPNELGIFDMGGNIQEWVNDWYGAYTDDPQTNPKGPKSSGIGKILRGGNFLILPEYGRPSYRSVSNPNFRSPFIGFRLAM